jgi:hypothetical protein
VKPHSIDEWWAELTAEYASQKREVPREDTLWYELALRHLEMRLAIARSETRANVPASREMS